MGRRRNFPFQRNWFRADVRSFGGGAHNWLCCPISAIRLYIIRGANIHCAMGFVSIVCRFKRVCGIAFHNQHSRILSRSAMRQIRGKWMCLLFVFKFLYTKRRDKTDFYWLEVALMTCASEEIYVLGMWNAEPFFRGARRYIFLIYNVIICLLHFGDTFLI